ncbi:hypothetical protein JB92DRAFT_2909820, partial [Gautieria morchelliformis]
MTSRSKATSIAAAPKKRAENTVWSVAEEMEMLDILLEQKGIGNASENGFKPSVWTLVVTALENFEGPPSSGHEKDVKACKARFQRLRADYKILQKLHELSGFGWDEGKQIVTANEEVWANYLISHKKARPFKKKPFPFFDKLAELCGDVIATGDGVFSASTAAREESSDSNQGGSDGDGEGDIEYHEDSGAQLNHALSSSSVTASTPSHGLKRQAQDSGSMPVKRNRRSGADGLFAMSNAVVAMAGSLASSTTAASVGLTSPE